MLGGIIGDLAATTWQRDKSTFYKRLIAPDVCPTDYGKLALSVAQHLATGVEFDFLSYMQQREPLTWEERTQLNLIPMASIAWTEDDPEKAILEYKKKFTNTCWEKEDFYAFNTIIPLIVSLRQGKTKDEAVASLDEMFRINLLKWPKSERGSLGAIARAWDAFYRSFDFTSAIHSAVKSPVEPNLTAITAGLLGEAMYGCEIGMLKRKYSNEPYFLIELPEGIDTTGIRAYKERMRRFFPKNRALTNVERHVWTPMPNKYSGILFDEIMYHNIKMAFDTDWDNRYGLYLDNGWFYVYRSHVLLSRFKIKQKGDRYTITDTQRSDEKPEDARHAMEEALNSISHHIT